MEKLGTNWQKKESVKPLVVFFGVLPADRPNIVKELSQYRCAFAFPRTPWLRQCAFLQAELPAAVWILEPFTLLAPVAACLSKLGVPVLRASSVKTLVKDVSLTHVTSLKTYYPLVLYGKNWMEEMPELPSVALFCSRAVLLRSSVTQLFPGKIWAFVPEDLSDTTRIVSFLNAFSVREAATFNKDTISPALKALFASRSLPVSEVPESALLKTVLVPCADSFAARMDSSETEQKKPKGILFGAAQDISRLASTLDRFSLYRLSPDATLADIGAATGYTLIYLGDDMNPDVKRFAKTNNLPLLWYRQSLLGRLGYRKNFPTLLFEEQADESGNDEKRLAAGDKPDVVFTARAGEFRKRLVGLNRQLVAKDDDASPERPHPTDIAYVMAIYHAGEDSSGPRATDFFKQVIGRESGKNIYCLYIENGSAGSLSQALELPLRKKCFFLKHVKDYDHLAASAEKIHVICSTLGFEALLDGRTVVTHGQPFYAGWGLTQDLSCPRRGQDLSLDELTAQAFFTNSRYTAPYTDVSITPEQALAFQHLRNRPDFSYIFESLQQNFGQDPRYPFFEWRYKYYAAPPETTQWLIEQLDASNTAPGRLLADLLGRRTTLEGLSLWLEDAPSSTANILFQTLLVYCQNNMLFDVYAKVCKIFVDWFEKMPALANTELQAFYNAYSFAISNNRFRDLGPFPSFRQPDYKNVKEVSRLQETYAEMLLKSCRYAAFEVFMADHKSSFSLSTILHILKASLDVPISAHERDMTRRLALRFNLLEHFCETARPVPGLQRPIAPIVVTIASHCFAHKMQELETCIRETKKSLKELPELFSCEIELLELVVNWLRCNRLYGLGLDLIDIQQNNAVDKATYQKRLIRSKLDVRLAYGHNPENRAREMSQSLESMTKERAALTTVEAIWALTRRYARQKLFEETSIIMSRTEQPANPRGYVFVPYYVPATPCLALIVNSLAARGYATVILSPYYLYVLNDGPRTPVHNYTFSLHEPCGMLYYEWTIKPKEKIVSALGINFYDRIFEELTILLRNALLDWNDPFVSLKLMHCIQDADITLRHCERIHQSLRVANSKGVVLINSAHLIPNVAWLDYTTHAGTDGRFHCAFFRIGTAPAVEQDGIDITTTVNAIDLTLYKQCRLPFLPPPVKFDTWYASFLSRGDVRERLDAARQSFENTRPVSRVHEDLMRQKLAGKRIICCYGRLLYDHCLRVEGGQAHTDMMDWLKHSIEIAASTPDLILLIKPHPHELDPVNACDPMHVLRDVLPETLPENVVYLPPDEISTPQLKGLVDLAIMWVGTAAYELTALGVPTMVCAYSGQWDLPFHVLTPESRENYAEWLRAKTYLAPDDALRDRAAAFSLFIRSEAVLKPFPYVAMSDSNDYWSIPYFNHQAVERYFQEGDRNIEDVVDLIIEGLESEKGALSNEQLVT